MSWNEWMNWHEWIDMNKLKWINWNERIERNEWPKMPKPKIFLWNRALATIPCTFCRPYRSKVAWGLHFFTNFCDQLLDDDVVDIWIRALATVSCAFCRSHLPKVVWTGQFFATATVWCTFCRPLVPIEASNRGNRDPPAATTDGHLGFAPESAFKREFTCSRSLTLPNYLMMMRLTWWCGWHDDVVDMMMWIKMLMWLPRWWDS